MDPQRLQHLAALTGLRLTPDERRDLAREMDLLVEFVSDLPQVDRDPARKVEDGGAGAVTGDRAVRSEVRCDARLVADNAPDFRDGFFQVPGVDPDSEGDGG